VLSATSTVNTARPVAQRLAVQQRQGVVELERRGRDPAAVHDQHRRERVDLERAPRNVGRHGDRADAVQRVEHRGQRRLVRLRLDEHERAGRQVAAPPRQLPRGLLARMAARRQEHHEGLPLPQVGVADGLAGHRRGGELADPRTDLRHAEVERRGSGRCQRPEPADHAEQDEQVRHGQRGEQADRDSEYVHTDSVQ
jgi:hypothetical protein